MEDEIVPKLIEAIESKNEKKFTQCLALDTDKVPDLGFEISSITNDVGENLLHFAQASGAIEIARILINIAPNLITTGNSEKVTPFHIAIREQLSPFIRLYQNVYDLSRPYNIQVADEFGRTLLHDAARYDNLEVVLFLLSNGCRSTYDNYNYTPYDYAKPFYPRIAEQLHPIKLQSLFDKCCLELQKHPDLLAAIPEHLQVPTQEYLSFYNQNQKTYEENKRNREQEFKNLHRNYK